MDAVDPPTQPIQHPDNDVLTLTVYRLEPECISYMFKMRSKYEPKDPEHLEQLIVMTNVVKKLKKQAEAGLLMKHLEISREVRKALHDARIEGEANADNRPTGGEPQPN